MNSPKNKTIDISADEYADLIGACITADSPMSPEACIDKTVCGAAFDVLGFLPRGFFDLLIADPPYNLDKTFDGEKFRISVPCGVCGGEHLGTPRCRRGPKGHNRQQVFRALLPLQMPRLI